MKIKTLGEFGLIERVKKKAIPLKSAVLGIDDDCAVIDYTKDRYLLLTVDMLIDGVHFNLRKAGPKRVGRKALAVSLSDIAAMGGVPKYCLISVGLPPNMPVKVVDDFYAGFVKLAKEYKVELIGGDTNKSDKLICDVCVVGEVEKHRLVKRSGAKIGDKIYVTGRLGGSIKVKQYNFTPKVKEARILVKNFKVNAMIDISDGLSSDLRHIAESSNTGALIYEKDIPISKGSSLKGALTDGEDFELLFTMPGNVNEKVLTKKLGVRVSMIGEIVAEYKNVTIVDKSGKRVGLKPAGYRHF
ncbi:MAG: thiamine-phosphate kinase [Candidatus Omnitrophica bacterium]|nr:thiamine-phosphate kinase [Candidatus Omnitrophota bacterium]MBU4487865.1 thiamine-phosphate kinase [Candidatus Omnitrophota bacterium]MCG2704648.1 thiamine-phosphate kinase [Candidatus Omnitrophota bacterium]